MASQPAYKDNHYVSYEHESLTGGVGFGGGGSSSSSSYGNGGGGYGRAPRGEQIIPELHQVYQVKVKSIMAYGAFCGIVKDDGKSYKDGLLLKMRMS